MMGLGDVTLSGGAVLGPVNGTLGCVDAVGDMVGRYVASIFCRILMAYIFSSPTANGVSGDGLWRTSVKYSTNWRVASVEDIFGTGKLCGKNSTFFIILSACVAGA